MTAITTRIIAEPTEADHLAILNPLLAFNEAKTGDDRYRSLAISLSDETCQVAGGLWAKFYYDWLFVELLFVPEKLRGRGLGASLLRQAEEWTKKQSCNGIWRDTSASRQPASTRNKATSSSARSMTIRAGTGGCSSTSCCLPPRRSSRRSQGSIASLMNLGQVRPTTFLRLWSGKPEARSHDHFERDKSIRPL